MFDISFSELMLIAIVALVVIGPERLPRVARTLGLLFGRMQRYVSDVKADINRELQLDELKQLQANIQASARDFERDIGSMTGSMTESVSEGVQSLESSARPAFADVSSEATEATDDAHEPPGDAANPGDALPQSEIAEMTGRPEKV